MNAKIVLVLNCLRRRAHGLKFHPTDWEKPGIEPATPGLQDIGFTPTPRRLRATIITKKKNIYISKYVDSNLVDNILKLQSILIGCSISILCYNRREPCKNVHVSYFVHNQQFCKLIEYILKVITNAKNPC